MSFSAASGGSRTPQVPQVVAAVMALGVEPRGLRLDLQPDLPAAVRELQQSRFRWRADSHQVDCRHRRRAAVVDR